MHLFSSTLNKVTENTGEIVIGSAVHYFTVNRFGITSREEARRRIKSMPRAKRLLRSLGLENAYPRTGSFSTPSPPHLNSSPLFRHTLISSKTGWYYGNPSPHFYCTVDTGLTTGVMGPLITTVVRTRQNRIQVD